MARQVGSTRTENIVALIISVALLPSKYQEKITTKI
ncbi:hypothetical protein BCEN4_850013 [Burkholderia cenocepacia]|nr:hypothetical protein BCEN4_850013 [Burkholderia cenocepacia]